MKIGLLDVDLTGFPNIALGKISRYHKSKGDTVEWYNPLFEYDKVYLSKIFTFTPDYGYYINSREVEKGAQAMTFIRYYPKMSTGYNPITRYIHKSTAIPPTGF